MRHFDYFIEKLPHIPFSPINDRRDKDAVLSIDAPYLLFLIVGELVLIEVLVLLLHLLGRPFLKLVKIAGEFSAGHLYLFSFGSSC